MQTVILSVALYSCETSLALREKQRFESFKSRSSG